MIKFLTFLIKSKKQSDQPIQGRHFEAKWELTSELIKFFRLKYTQLFLAILILLILLWTLYSFTAELLRNKFEEFDYLEYTTVFKRKISFPLRIENFVFNEIDSVEGGYVSKIITEALEIQNQKNGQWPTLGDVDLAHLQDALRQSDWIIDAGLIRLQAGKILIDITEEKPAALYIQYDKLINKNQFVKRYYLVNHQGDVYTEISNNQLNDFDHLLSITGVNSPDFLHELLSAQSNFPKLMERFEFAKRLHLAGWKLWFRRPDVNGKYAGRYYVYVQSKSREDFIVQLKLWQKLKNNLQLDKRDALGFDMRNLPKLLVEVQDNQQDKAE